MTFKEILDKCYVYLIRRYLGQYFQTDLNSSQLDLNLRQGTCHLQDIHLDVQALNELADKQNWPLEFVNGSIEKLSIIVPWKSVLTESCSIEVTNLKITMQPKQRTETATSMFESMWSSMTTSIALAAECTKELGESLPNTSQSYEGLDKFAQAIESILNRTKVKFLNSVFQFEYLPSGSHVGVGVVFNIDVISYSDESSGDPTKAQATNVSKQEDKKSYFEQSYTARSTRLQGVRISTMEFSSRARTVSDSVIFSNSEIFNKHSDYTESSEGLNLFDLMDKNSANTTANNKQLSSSTERNVVPFANFVGDIDVIVKLKRTEDLEGPKVLMELNMAPLILFLSPRQIQLFSEFASGLSTPDTDHSNVSKTTPAGKPMSSADYERIQRDLQNQFTNLPLHFHGIAAAQGWGTGNLEGSDTEETFLPVENYRQIYESAMSVASTMDSSTTSSATSLGTEATSRTHKKFTKMETDPTAEISKFNIHLSYLALVLLHEDKLTEDVKTNLLLSSTVKQMQSLAQNFFEVSNEIFLSKNPNLCINSILNKACRLNHLRLLASPLHMEADERTTSTAISISGYLESTTFDLSEYLYDTNKVEQIPLLTFQDLSTSKNTTQLDNCAPIKSSVKLGFKHIARTPSNFRKSGPKTDLNFNLDNCTVDLDITIIDRISALFNLQSICAVAKGATVWKADTAYLENHSSESKTNIKVTSPNMFVKIRFPKPDLRPPSEWRDRWWARHVRTDYLSLALHGMSFSTSLSSNQSIQDYTVQCRNMNIDYHEDASCLPIQIAKAGYEDGPSSLQHILPECKLNIKIVPSSHICLNDGLQFKDEIMTTSIAGFLEKTKPNNGPFASKNVFYESNTTHSDRQKDDTKELLVPGLKSEISDFIISTTSSARLRIDIVLPTVSMQLNSKHLFETIYNRINNDLLLWESSALKPRASPTAYDNTRYALFEDVEMDDNDLYRPCISGIQHGSESEGDDDDDSSDIFYSTYGSRMKMPQKYKLTTDKEESYLTLNLQIARGLLCLFTPVRDASGNNVIPGQQAEFLVNVENASFFMVNGYKDDPDLVYLCSEVQKAQLYHCGMLSAPSHSPPLKDIESIPARHLLPTIYSSESGMLINSKKDDSERNMISLCVKIKANHETHNVKNMSIAVGFDKITLRHRMSNAPNSWVSQLFDFFNVKDYPTPGYHAKQNLTEVFVHFWNSAIDYRPLHLPLRTAITVGTFSISSHLSEEANTSTLRFIAEEGGLFISKINSKGRAIHVDLRRDYINVIEFGLFDISLVTSDKKCTENPHFDLRASNNIIHIRTCVDSATSLTQLMKYLANNGDLINSDLSSSACSAFSSPRHLPNQDLVSVEPQEIANLSESQHKQVNELIQDAIKDVDQKKNKKQNEPEYKYRVVTSTDGDKSKTTNQVQPEYYSYTGAKMFFFPGEKTPADVSDGKPLPQVTTELGRVVILPPRPSEIDDEFCFIDEEPGYNIFPKSGTPEIKWLTEDRVRIVENHFTVPTGKCDPLATPKNFPVPTTKYTLREMSVVWHMYGGNDFGNNKGLDKKKNVNFSDLASKNSACPSAKIKKNEEVESGREKKPWWVLGGVNRNKDVLMEIQLNKIKVLHEIYPETSSKASRQVLVVTDLEVRDRLKDSQINKFLYQYTSQLRPKQSNASMLVIKSLLIRPDPQLRTQECSVRISLLPLKLNIDQDALQFLISYFAELGNDGHEDLSSLTSTNSTPVHQPPIMTVADDNEERLKEAAKKMIDENLLILLEENKNEDNMMEEESTTSSMSGSEGYCPIYFRNVIFSPDVPIILDYHGKHLDLTTHGPIQGLVLGLGQLNCSEIRLKRLSYRRGLLGLDKLLMFLWNEWATDIKKNQIPSLLVGVGPMHSFVQLFQGIRDLFCLPFEQYKKDGRFFRGLHRGANSFTLSTIMAALELTTRFILLIQITAETAFDMLTPGPSVRINPKTKRTRKRYNRPKDIREGVTNAYKLVKEGIEETADNILQVASHEHEQKGYSGAVGGVIRQIPPTIIKPIIIASEATNNVLGGVRCQLVPDARKESNDKWRKVESYDSNL